jgi:hypothetical protein
VNPSTPSPPGRAAGTTSPARPQPPLGLRLLAIAGGLTITTISVLGLLGRVGPGTRALVIFAGLAMVAPMILATRQPR